MSAFFMEMRRVLFSSSCSPTLAQCVKNVNARRFEQTYSLAVETICDRHYVDDYADCFQTEKEAIKTVKEVIFIHQKAGFKLRQINSNSTKVKQLCNNILDAVSIDKDVDRILGMYWCTSTDYFILRSHTARYTTVQSQANKARVVEVAHVNFRSV